MLTKEETDELNKVSKEITDSIQHFLEHIDNPTYEHYLIRSLKLFLEDYERDFIRKLTIDTYKKFCYDKVTDERN